MFSEAPVTPVRELREGAGGRFASAGVDYARLGKGRAGGYLELNQRQEVSRMHAIANLMTGSVKTDVAQGFSMKVAVYPVTENSLVRPAKLTGARNDATTVQPHIHPEARSIFESKRFAGQLGGSIERHGRTGGKVLSDSGLGNAGRKRYSVGD